MGSFHNRISILYDNIARSMNSKIMLNFTVLKKKIKNKHSDKNNQTIIDGCSVEDPWTALMF